MKLSFPQHDLVLEDHQGGLWVEQGKKKYLARRWQLTNQVIGIIQLALAKDLRCLWQEGHPGKETSHHISFSFSHEPASWVFCIGVEAGPPKVKKITISKKVRGILTRNDINPFWENAGGKNFSIVPEKLPAFLDLVEKSKLKDISNLAPFSFHRKQTAQITDFQSERDLEDCIVEAIGETGVSIHRQRRFRSSHFIDSRDIPDIIVEALGLTIVVELKLYRAIEPDIVQLSRYLANAELRAAFTDRAIHGVLIAAGFDASLQNAAVAIGNCSLYSYAEKTGLPLRLIAGPDVLEPFLLPPIVTAGQG